MPGIVEKLEIAPHEVVALVGAGGMAGLTLKLAADLISKGRRILSTSTVNSSEMHPPEPFYFLIEPDLEAVKSKLPGLMRRYSQVRLATEYLRADKIRGIEPDWVPALAAIPEVDNVIVQCDGARHKPLKAPKVGEPVLPSQADLLLALAGLDVLGKPLNEENVHRAERVSALVGLREGEQITPEGVAKVISHPEGGLKGAPEGARVWFVLTGWNAANDQAARLIGRQALDSAPGARGVLLVASGHAGSVDVLKNKG